MVMPVESGAYAHHQHRVRVEKTIDVTLPTREREQIANDVGIVVSTGVSAPNKVLDRDTWESQSDADRQSARWHTG